LVICAACRVNASDAEWIRLPDVPVNVTVDEADGAVSAAVRVVVCAAPGVRLSVAGFAVTPVGRPVIATITVPLKAFKGFIVTLRGEPDVPAMMVCDVGDMVSVKSGGGRVMVSITVAVWVRAPELPVRVSVAVAAAAAAEAVMVTVCAVPGVRVSIAG
jgi:hypothetical protein